MAMLLPVFFGILSQIKSPENAKLAMLNCLGTLFQVEFSFLFKSFLAKFIFQVDSSGLNLIDLNGISISTVQFDPFLFTSAYHLLSQAVVTPIPPPLAINPSL